MRKTRWRTIALEGGIFALIVLVSIVLVRCGGSSNSMAGMGSANVTISDPPSCANFSHVWVTIDGVSANISGTSDSGWQTLVSNLSSSSGSIQAVQVDLLHLPANGQCLLAQLGSTSSLPAGNYQQIRLQLVANGAAGVTLLSPSGESTSNQCSGGAWNCVELSGQNSTSALDLSSQAQTGLKIPPGQVMGGPISVAAGKSVDIDIDFDACRSVIQEGTGQYRLDPVLVGYQASQNNTGISGQVVQGAIVTNNLQVTTNPVSGANVALEMSSGNPADGTNSVDLIGNYVKMTDSNGNFDFCPLPSGPFDVVADAGGSSAPTFNATIVTGVPNGAQVTLPLLPEVGTTTTAATLSGLITATTANSSATFIDADAYALQQATSTLEFAVPLLTGSNPALSQLSVPCTTGNCTTASPVFSLVVPASNPLIGAYSTSQITWTVPAAPPVNYKVEATCTGTSSPPPIAQFSTTQTVTPGNTTGLGTGQPPTLSGCQ